MSLTILTDGFLRTKISTTKSLAAFILTLFFLLFSFSAHAQFEAPEFEKLSKGEQIRTFGNINLTGQGLYQSTKIDDLQTNEIRARLQAAFGDPTRTLRDLINTAGFRPGKAIQFEYWFAVDDSIPMVVLDWDGPFGSGLTFGGSSKYVDLMPQIKRAFEKKLMSVDTLGNYQDYFYSPERQQWYMVKYEDGSFTTSKIESPDDMSVGSN